MEFLIAEEAYRVSVAAHFGKRHRTVKQEAVLQVVVTQSEEAGARGAPLEWSMPVRELAAKQLLADPSPAALLQHECPGGVPVQLAQEESVYGIAGRGRGNIHLLGAPDLDRELFRLMLVPAGDGQAAGIGPAQFRPEPRAPLPCAERHYSALVLTLFDGVILGIERENLKGSFFGVRDFDSQVGFLRIERIAVGQIDAETNLSSRTDRYFLLREGEIEDAWNLL